MSLETLYDTDFNHLKRLIHLFDKKYVEDKLKLKNKIIFGDYLDSRSPYSTIKYDNEVNWSWIYRRIRGVK